MSSRSSARQAEKDELYYRRGQVKDLQEKVARYQVKSNNKFFEVEPIMEANARLREQLEAAAAEHRQQLDAQREEAQPCMPKPMQHSGCYALTPLEVVP